MTTSLASQKIFWHSSESQKFNRSHWAKSRYLTRLCSFLKAPGEPFSLSFPISRGCLHSLACGFLSSSAKPVMFHIYDITSLYLSLTTAGKESELFKDALIQFDPPRQSRVHPIKSFTSTPSAKPLCQVR